MSLRNVSAHLSHYNEELHPKIEQNKILKCYACSLIVLNGNRTWCSSQYFQEPVIKPTISQFTVIAGAC
jgi:hypothetical protein